MKRIISIIMTLCLIITSVCLTDVSASLAAGNPSIYSTTITGQAGSEISVPIYIGNNTGLMGYVLEFSYDSRVLTPVSVTRGNVLTTGNFDDDIETTGSDGLFKVIWNDVNNNTSNGFLFTIKFAVDRKANGTSTISIDYDGSDTYDENYDDVSLSCSDVTVNINNSSYNSLTRFNMWPGGTVNTGETFSVEIGIENNTLEHADINLTYDSENFRFVSESFDNNIVQSSVSENNGVITIHLSNMSVVSDIDELGVLVFECYEYANSGRYTFTCNCEKQNGNEVAYCNDSYITVPSSATSDSALISAEKQIVSKGTGSVTIPVMINSNPGIMGYKISFAYDSSDLEIISATGTDPFAAHFGNTIVLGSNSGSFSCIWYDTEQVTDNGEILELVFDILSSDEKTSVINVSYSQQDTFNEDDEDVMLVCNDIEIVINHEHSYDDGVVTKQPTLDEEGETTYTCSGCGATYTEVIPNITPSPSPTPTPTASPSSTPTATASPSPTPTPTASPTPTPTASPTPTPTASPSPTPTPTASPTSVPTATPEPTSEPTATPEASATPTSTTSPATVATMTPTPVPGNAGPTPITEEPSATSDIKLARVKITSVKNNAASTVRVKWKKVKGAYRYQVQYSLKKKFGNKPKGKTTKKTSIKLKKLMLNKRYFIRVRAVYIGDGNKKYGKWSAVKKIRIKQ